MDLISNKQRLEQDIRVKENSLKIDQQKCMTLRYQECMTLRYQECMTLVYQACMSDVYQTYKECRASMYQT